MPAFLAAENLHKVYPRAGGEVRVLEGCELRLEAGEAVAVTGLSGSGKSTLLNILGGLDEPDSGRVSFQGQDLVFSDRKALTRWRARTVGFVFQFHFLLPDFSALENLLIPVRAHGSVLPEARQRARELLDLMGLADRADHLPGELSGGEQQRVAVARAFMGRPQLVLADEPFGNLDRKIGGLLSELLFTIRQNEGTSLVIVTHDPQLAGRADRVLELNEGRLWPAPGGFR